MRLGIGSYTFGWASGTYGWEITRDSGLKHLSAQDLIDKAIELGVDLVQICVRPVLSEKNGKELEELRAYAEKRGIAFEVGTSGSDPEELLRYLQIAKALKAQLVRTIFTEASPGLKQEESQLAQVVAAFENALIHLAIENHEMYSYRDLAALIGRFASPYLGVCLDTVNSLGRGEGVEEVSKALLPYTACLHVKDFTVIRGGTDMGFSVVGTPAGQGKLNIPEQLARLKTHRPEASIVLELWTPFAESAENTVALQEDWAEQSIAFLKEVLSGL